MNFSAYTTLSNVAGELLPSLSYESDNLYVTSGVYSFPVTIFVIVNPLIALTATGLSNIKVNLPSLNLRVAPISLVAINGAPH